MEQVIGRWWRFERYQVRDGYIRPAPGADWEPYDPWKAHRLQKRPPYLELVDAISDVSPEAVIPTGHWAGFAGPRFTCSETTQERVLDWCARFGLLGLLPHDLLQARLAGSIVRRTSVGDSWVREPYFYERAKEPIAELVFDEGGSGAIPLAEPAAWYHYFPDVPGGEWESRQIAIPGSDEFWRGYAEPLNDFVATAARLRELVCDAADPAVGKRKRAVTASAFDSLNSLIASVRRTVALDRRGRPAASWGSPSLLGHLAMQVSQDLIGGSRLVRCVCGTVTTTSHPSKRWCSNRCGNRERVRRCRRL